MISVYLDTNVLILAFERSDAEGAHIWPVLEAIEAGEFQAKTSQITLSEMLPKPLMLGQADLAARYQHLFETQSIFNVLPVTLDILIEAALIRADRVSVSLPDAIHLATARRSSCTAILTADKRLRSFATPKVLTPGPACLAELRKLAG